MSDHAKDERAPEENPSAEAAERTEGTLEGDYEAVVRLLKENEELKDSFAQDVALLKYVGMHPVVVHGGGPQIDAAVKQAGITPRFVRGMRVTDTATMDIVEQVLAGKISGEIVADLNRHGARAVGLSGKDGELVVARKRGGGDEDLGLVGDVVGVNPDVIQALHAFVPVIAPTAADAGGQTYNINADVVAGKLAEVLKAEKLMMLTNTPGVLDKRGQLLTNLSAREIDELFADGTISGGMLPKISSALDAAKNGVNTVHIIDGRVPHAMLLEILTEQAYGTMIRSH